MKEKSIMFILAAALFAILLTGCGDDNPRVPVKLEIDETPEPAHGKRIRSALSNANLSASSKMGSTSFLLGWLLNNTMYS